MLTAYHGFVRYDGAGDGSGLIRMDGGRCVLMVAMEEESCYRKYYDRLPTAEVLTADVEDLVNAWVEDGILTGYVWKGQLVWLSVENQLNYRCAVDAAELGGLTFPYRVRVVGGDGVGYVELSDAAELRTFWLGVQAHIRKLQEHGWVLKDGVIGEDLLNTMVDIDNE